MQKLRLGTAALAAMLLLALSGCGAKAPISAGESSASSTASSVAASSVASSEVESAAASSEAGSGTEVVRTFGKYTLAPGWEPYEKFSTEEKVFYLKDGLVTKATPDNISVEAGANRYAAEEHGTFREAIMQQLMMQIKDSKSTLNGAGYNTESGLVVYQFTITTEADNIVTTQYYIIGDHKYVLVHETAEAGSEADEVAAGIVESFVWAEE